MLKWHTVLNLYIDRCIFGVSYTDQHTIILWWVGSMVMSDAVDYMILLLSVWTSLVKSLQLIKFLYLAGIIQSLLTKIYDRKRPGIWYLYGQCYPQCLDGKGEGRRDLVKPCLIISIRNKYGTRWALCIDRQSN